MRKMLNRVRNAAAKVRDLVRSNAVEYVIGFCWDQVSNMAVVGLFFYILIQNDAAASTFAQTIITTMQTTLQGYLTGSY